MKIKKRKVILLGLDGAVPYVIEEGVRKNRLPNFKKLFLKGVFSRALPLPSNVTPGNWASVATGAYPFTHGISDFNVHLPGTPLMERVDAFSSDIRLAEPLWDCLSRLGEKAATVSFPGALPRKSKSHLAIGDSGAPTENSFFYNIAKARCFATPNLNPVGAYNWREHETLSLASYKGWLNLPSYLTPLSEGEILVKAINPNREGKYQFYLLIARNENERRYTLLISPERNYRKTVAEIGQNQWSPWIKRDFLVKRGKITADFRFRARVINRDSLLLYLSQIYPCERFSMPQQYSKKLYKKFGPYNDALNISNLVKGWLDKKGFLDEFRTQGLWQAKAALELVNEMNFSLVMTKWHAFDKFYHVFFDKIDVKSPYFNKREYRYYEGIHQEIQTIADEMIGIVLQEMDKDTTLIVVSDHGLMASQKRLWVNNFLAKNGFIKVRFKKGEPVVDWSKTKAIMAPWVQIWINLKGRDPNGIVKPGKEYEEIREEIISLLRNWQDPETGKLVIDDAFKVDDGIFYGLGGIRDGDIRFFATPGYSLYRSVGITKDMKVITSLGTHYKGDHGSCKPTARFGRGSETALFGAIGAGIKKCGMRKFPIKLVDIAPTISYLIGVNPPSQCEGAVLYDIIK